VLLPALAACFVVVKSLFLDVTILPCDWHWNHIGKSTLSMTQCQTS